MPRSEKSNKKPTEAGTNHKLKPARGPLALLIATRKGAFILRVIGRLVVLIAVVCAILLSAAAQQTNLTFDRLSWIGGCWEGEMTGGAKTQEQWMRPEGNSMIGMSRTVVNGKTPFFEFLQIKQEGDNLVYVARPQGNEPTSFKLVKLNADAAIFENPTHDFPQRIIYQRQTDGSLLAVIEGTQSGKPKRVEFPMRRVRCD